MKALITVGCMTDHGGMIILGDFSFLVEESCPFRWYDSLLS